MLTRDSLQEHPQASPADVANGLLCSGTPGIVSALPISPVSINVLACAPSTGLLDLPPSDPACSAQLPPPCTVSVSVSVCVCVFVNLYLCKSVSCEHVSSACVHVFGMRCLFVCQCVSMYGGMYVRA